MPEQDVFQQVTGQRTAVDGHEAAGVAVTVRMHMLCIQFLAHPARPDDQDFGVGGGDRRQRREQVEMTAAAADQAVFRIS